MSDIPGQFLPSYVTDDIRGFSLQGAPNTHLNYVRKQQRESKESFCWIEIPISLLLCWETIHQHCGEFESYITLFNQFIPGAGFAVRRDCERVEEISLQLQQKDGVCQNINLNESDSTTSAATASCLSEDGKSEIENVLFLMDKFGVSEDFYHELTMTFSDLPRSYLVKKTKHELNKQCHLTKTPGEAPGVQCSFKELLKEHISELVSVTVFKQFSIVKIKPLAYLLFVSEKFD